MMKIRNIAIGISLGILLAFSQPVVVLVLGLFLVALWLMNTYIKTESKKFLMVIFITGFILRIILSFLNYHIAEAAGMGTDTQPDGRVYNSFAFYIASIIDNNRYDQEADKDVTLKRDIELIKSKYNDRLPPFGDYQNGIYTYMIGWLYAWLGYAPIAAKMINAIIGCVTAILVYFIAIFLVRSEMVAKISAAIMMFLPSTLYWSVTLLRDPIANCLFLLYVLMLLSYLRKINAVSVVGSFLFAVLLSLFKEKIGLLLAAGMVLIMLLGLAKRIVSSKRLRFWTNLMPAIIILLFVVILNHSIITTFIENKIDLMRRIHLSSSLNEGASSYVLYGNLKAGALNPFLLIFRALAYYLLSPFPWRIPAQHGLLLLFYPQILFTFVSIPFMIAGIIDALRKNFFIVSATLLLVALVMIPQAMAEGIIGNVVRHRDMFTPFLIIFSFNGLALLIRQQ